MNLIGKYHLKRKDGVGKKIGKVNSETRFILGKPEGREEIVVLDDKKTCSLYKFDSLKKAYKKANRILENIDYSKFNFSLIINHLKLNGEIELPFEIADNHFLVRANQNQKHGVFRHLASSSRNFRESGKYQYFEKDIKKINYTLTYSNLLDESNWKYYIIENRKNGWNHELNDLRFCLSLSSLELTLNSDYTTKAIF